MRATLVLVIHAAWLTTYFSSSFGCSCSSLSAQTLCVLCTHREEQKSCCCCCWQWWWWCMGWLEDDAPECGLCHLWFFFLPSLALLLSAVVECVSKLLVLSSHVLLHWRAYAATVTAAATPCRELLIFANKKWWFFFLLKTVPRGVYTILLCRQSKNGNCLLENRKSA